MYLRLFGAMSLRDESGKDWLEDFPQPKRTALLAYLMVAAPGDFVRRDVLLALFWPDATASDARRALNQASHYIRRMVGADVLQSRGAEAIGVDPSQLGCDVLDFDAAIRAGQHQRALELYRGHLMEGFFLSGLPELEEWLGKERSARARAAGDAAWALSASVRTPAEALVWGKRAYDLNSDEGSLRRLIQLHDRGGERVAALRLYDDFARRLRDDYGSTPSPETDAVIAQIRSRPAAAQPLTADSRSEALGAHAQHRVATMGRAWRRRAMLIGLPVSTVLAGAAALMVFGRGRAAQHDFAEGDAHDRAGRYGMAVLSFQRAVQRDTNFALAYYRLSQAATWTGDGAVSEWARNQAYAKRMTLNPHDRAEAEAWYWYQRTQIDSAQAAYQRVLAGSPNDAEAAFELADIHFHWGSTFGVPLASTAPEWARVMSLAPTNAAVLLHAARVAAASGNRSLFDSLAARLGQLEPDADRTVELLVLRAFAFGDHAQRVAAAHDVARLKGPVARDVFQMTASVTPGLVDVDDVLLPELFHTSFEGREDGQMLVKAQIAFARGHLRSAAAIMDSTMRLHPGHVRQFRALLSIVPYPAATADEQGEAAAALAGRPLPTFQRGAAMRDYLLGVIAVRQGDLALARRYAQALDTVAGTSATDTAYAIRVARIIRAEAAQAEGQIGTALQILGPPAMPPDGVLPAVWTYPIAHERFLRAELLEQSGRNDEALRWYATFPDPRAYDFMFLPAALLRSAELFARLGRSDEAAVRYRALVALWRTADPRLSAEVERLRRLVNAPPTPPVQQGR